MWELEPTGQWERDKRWYEKKRPQELAAVLHNLQRFLDLVGEAPNPRAVQAGFLHPEGGGLVAVDQKSGGGNLEETRCYFFCDEIDRVIYLITIGNKQSQKEDIKYSRKFINSLTKGKKG